MSRRKLGDEIYVAALIKRFIKSRRNLGGEWIDKQTKIIYLAVRIELNA